MTWFPAGRELVLRISPRFLADLGQGGADASRPAAAGLLTARSSRTGWRPEGTAGASEHGNGDAGATGVTGETGCRWSRGIASPARSRTLGGCPGRLEVIVASRIPCIGCLTCPSGRTRAGNAPENLVIVWHMALDPLRQYQTSQPPSRPGANWQAVAMTGCCPSSPIRMRSPAPKCFTVEQPSGK